MWDNATNGIRGMGYRRSLVQLRIILIRMPAQRACDAYEWEHYIKNDFTEGIPYVILTMKVVGSSSWFLYSRIKRIKGNNLAGNIGLA